MELPFQVPIFTVSIFVPISRYPSPIAPDPDSPDVLPNLSFSPQHLIALSLVNAHENVSPSATSMNVRSSPTSVKYK